MRHCALSFAVIAFLACNVVSGSCALCYAVPSSAASPHDCCNPPHPSHCPNPASHKQCPRDHSAFENYDKAEANLLKAIQPVTIAFAVLPAAETPALTPAPAREESSASVHAPPALYLLNSILLI